MKVYEVQCPSCCGTFHKTTDKFDKDRPANGAMFRLNKQCRNAAWESFPEYDSTEYANVVCPSCGTQYLDALGKVIRLNETGETITDTEEFVEKTNALTSEEEIRSPLEYPEFGADKKAQCPFCDRRITKSWWKRHITKEHSDKLLK
ncbi:MAG: hypothetical protein GY820_38995 [Gammaproteobacteria bacterium]|nr:hypothetical protein [Gammaproteobacteria bacterium]